jgi:hypothetical protein
MTRFDTVAKLNRPKSISNRPARSERDVRAMLREIAFVLHCTRQINTEILAEREGQPSRDLTCEANAV